MTTVKISPVYNGVQQLDNNGNPLNGGLLYQYQAGSNTIQQTTYSDFSGTTPNPNPLVLDSSGRLPSQIWLDDSLTYNLVVKNSSGTVVSSEDNITGTVSGGSPGVSFPLLTSDWSNVSNTEIAWVQNKEDYPQPGDSRIRGTTGTNNNGDTVFQSSQVYYNLFDESGLTWQTTSETLLGGDICCGIPALVVHIPNLTVDTFSGGSFVNNLSTQGNGLTVSSPTGYVGVNLTRPSLTTVNAANVTTVETKLSGINSPGQGFYLDSPLSQPTYRFTVLGSCTSSTSGTTTFKIRMGYSDSTSDTLLASFPIVSAATGTNVPFKAEFYVSLRINTSTFQQNVEISSMSLNNQDVTGITTQTWTGAAPQTGSFNYASSGWLNLYCVTNSSSLVIHPQHVIAEQVL